jgi:hypothetical protein
MILLAVILAVLGFILAFVCNGVLKTADTPVLKCMFMVFLWGAANFGVGHVLEEAQLSPIVTGISSLATSFIVLTLILVIGVQANFKQGALIAGIYSAVLFLLTLGLASCAA